MARNYKQEYENYQGTDEQKKNRSKRNAARREKMKTGAVRKGDGKDIDHATPLSKGGSNSAGNLRVKSASANRSFARTKNGAIK